MEALMNLFSILFTLIGSIASAISAWVAIKGKKHVTETLKTIIKNTSKLKILSKLGLQEKINALSSTYLKWSTRIKENRHAITIFTYGGITGVFIMLFCCFGFYIYLNGWEKTIGFISPSPEKETLGPSLYGGMNIITLFWMYILIFFIIGGNRGWKKELMVTFCAITALAVNLLLERYAPSLHDVDKTSLFWVRTLILIGLVYFGYQSVVTVSVLTTSREDIYNLIFGALLGSFNGYLVAGTFLSYNHFSEYPIPDLIAPATDPLFVERVQRLISILPPNILGEPGIYVVVIIMLILIIVVFD